MTLRFLLGDQLNQQHSWFQETSEDVIYFMAEMRQETDYTKHHIQKIVAFFRAMRRFDSWMKDQGHQTVYYDLEHSDNTQDLSQNIKAIIKKHKITRFEYQLPDEYRLDQQLQQLCQELDLETEAFDTEHFMTTRYELKEFFEGKKQLVMEYFYRYMRKKYDIMMATHKDPEGGKWNYDQSNRKKWTGDPKPPIEKKFDADVSGLVNLIKKHNIQTIGTIDPQSFDWPTTREEGLETLMYFCKHLLQHFGDFQDAMDPDEPFLFHSRLSFAMNSKLITPLEVVQTVVTYWHEQEPGIDISQVEGYVRQIIGWREYMRGIYWRQMPDYETKNALDNQNPLPEFYWTANTKMNCLHHSIKQSLDKAYAHHIQRLMITGNFALLMQCHPDEVDDWYLGIYIDAIQWVEITNTRGMSQFADGGIVATKPYVSSGSYINKMSTYCKGCHYKVSKRTEDNACPFNSLYWNFLDDKRSYFDKNPRMALMMNLLDKLDREELAAIKKRAYHIIENPEAY